MNPYRAPVKKPPPAPELKWFNEYMSPVDAYNIDDFVNALGRVNGFSARDLEANRNGLISRGQWWRLARRAFRPLMTSAKVFLSLMLTVYVIDLLMPWIGRLILAKKAGLSLGTVAGGSAISFVFGLLETTKLTVLLAVDIFQGRVATRQGRIAPSWEERPAEGMGRLYGQKETAYFYVIRNEYFEVDAAAHSVLDERFQGYLPLVTMYYTPRSRLMLAVEPITTMTEETYVISDGPEASPSSSS